MMNITIEKKNFDKVNIEGLKERCAEALDALWNAQWLRRSITKADRRGLAQLQAAADQVAESSDVVVVLAEGTLAKLIRAAVSAAEPKEEKARVMVFGDTLSPYDYAHLLKHLDHRSFSIIAASDCKESPALIGAYATMKQHLISRFGKEQAAERLFAAAGKNSEFFAKEAAEEDFTLFSGTDLPAEFGAGTTAVLLSLAVKGVDLNQYLDGFYDMLASPAWDLDAADYAVARAVCGLSETLIVWQRQLRELAAFFGTAQMMPEDFSEEERFETLILIEKDAQDIMMPFFEGCHEDGSLNLLMTDTARNRFDDEKPGVKITLEAMDDYNLGQLLAFFQLSRGITAYLQAL